MRHARRSLPLLIALCGLLGATRPARLTWDRSTLVLIQPGGNYPRLAKVGDHLLCCFEFRRRIGVRRSDDAGRTWGPLVDVAGYGGGAAANPELLPTGGDGVLLFFNGRPRRGSGRPFTIEMATSIDGGRTWTPRAQPLYAAGDHFGDGCYEPAAVRLPGGQVQLFFANEHGHAADGSQAIDRMTSDNGGRTWAGPTVVSYRRGGRDGMPVPTPSVDRRSVLLSIEDNGLTGDHQLQPAVERLPTGPMPVPIDGGDPRRRAAAEWPAGAYAGAPYLRLFPDGRMVLSCQPDVGHPGVQRMAVLLGDAAGHFSAPTDPFPADAGRPAQWGSLYVSPATVTAACGTTIDGRFGAWAIDGHLTEGE